MVKALAIPEPVVPATTAQTIYALQARLYARRLAFISLGAERRCDAILAAVDVLLDHPDEVGAYLDLHVAPSSGLSRQMVRWAASQVLGELAKGGLHGIVRSRLDGGPNLHIVRPNYCDIVLAGNVFTASIQPIALALGLGIPVFCKCASGQSAFPLLLECALSHADAEVAQALKIVTFSRDDKACAAAFLSNADLVVGYGDDETMQELRRETRPTTRLVEHGHGISVAYLGAESLSDPNTASGLALDIAAYDQRGCLSPQIVWLDSKSPENVKRSFLQALDEALTALHRMLPRGPLGAVTAAAQMQWRAVAAIEGVLIEAPDHAIAYTSSGRLGPGPQSRNILVRDCDGPDELAQHLASFATHLKQVGLACHEDETRQLLAALAPNQAPRICAIGHMQKPPFSAFSEGFDAANGLLKAIQIDLPAAS